METGTFAADTATRLLERLAYQVNATLHATDADGVHDLRVAVRRFSQSLSLFKPVFPGREVKKIRRRLTEVMDVTNELRDCDIAIELLPQSQLAGVAALLDPLRQRRKDAARILQSVLRRWGARKTSSKWRSALTPNGGGHTPLEDTARDRLSRITKRFLRDADKASSARQLHEVRIEGKKLRYSLEIFRPVYQATAKEAMERVKAVQTSLGKVNDCHAVRVLVKDLGGDPDIEAWLKKRQRKKAREFRKSWPERADALRQTIGALKHPPRKPVGRSAAALKTAAQA